MVGPGKYDEETTLVMDRVKARAVILIVFGGAKGSGFSVQATEPTMVELPAMLRGIADEMEADINSGKAFQ